MRRYDFPQYSSSWWAIRRGVPGASDASKIITPAKGELSKSADAFVCELLAQPFDPMYGVVEDYRSAAMLNGQLMEPEARAFYSFARDLPIETAGFCTTDDGKAGCSPDALVGDDGGLEVKSPAYKTHIEYLLDGGLPLEYKPQVHWSLVVTGRKWWDFMSYARGLPELLVRVEPDEYTEKVRAAMATFLAQLDDARQRLLALVKGAGPADVHAAFAHASPAQVADILGQYRVTRIQDLKPDQLAEAAKSLMQAAF